MIRENIAQKVQAKLKGLIKFTPTAGQEVFIRKFSQFASDDQPGIFLLKGYAGTGKTTMMAALTSAFSNIVLLAPTGRAAKVLSSYTGRPAFTIHKHLYRPATAHDGRVFLRLMENIYQKTLFIVDEASMIPDASIDDASAVFPGVNLLNDLIRYVFSNPSCRLMLVGDTAQLPPVHFDYSPALDADHLRARYGKMVMNTELTEVVRQQDQSEILLNATAIRNVIIGENFKCLPLLMERGAVQRMNPQELPESMIDFYKNYGKDNVMIITRSNRSSIQYNRVIRFQTLWMDDEIGGGDSLMVVKNNYFWLPDGHPAGFIANGEVVEVVKVYSFTDRHGFRFAMASLRFPEYPDEPAVEAMIMLDTLSSEAASLPSNEQQRLFEALHLSYMEEEPDKKRRIALVKKDPYYNALQVKFAYAVTCHKAQGGQWPVVVVDQGYLTEEMMDKSYFRWLYTAFTRATEKLFLLNFDDKFFK